MVDRLRFDFPDDGVTAHARLSRERAPRTCEAIWRGLPFEGLARHGIYSGSEVLLFIPPDIQPPRENATSRVEPGDLAYYSFEARSAFGEREPVAEIAWFYGDDARPSMPGGPVAVNVFARFDEGFEELAALCHRMRLEGAKRLRVSRED